MPRIRKILVATAILVGATAFTSGTAWAGGGFGFHFHRSGVFGPHAPVGRVQVMGAPAGDHSGSELLAAKPSRPGEIGLHDVFT